MVELKGERWNIEVSQLVSSTTNDQSFLNKRDLPVVTTVFSKVVMQVEAIFLSVMFVGNSTGDNV